MVIETGLIDLDLHDIAAAQLAVDREVEQR